MKIYAIINLYTFSFSQSVYDLKQGVSWKLLSHSKWQFACLSTPLRPIPSRRLLSYLMEASARKSISHGSVHFSLVFVFFHLPQSDVSVSMSLTVKYTGEWIAIFMKLPDQNQLLVKDKRVVVRIAQGARAIKVLELGFHDI